MSTVYKIQPSSSRTPSTPSGYVTQYSYKQGDISKVAYMFSDSEVYTTPFLTPYTIYVGPTRKFTTLQQAASFLNNASTGNVSTNIYFDAGTYTWPVASDFSKAHVYLRKTNQSDSVTFQMSGPNTYWQCSFLECHGINFSGSFQFTCRKYLLFWDCSFQNDVTIRACNRVYVTNCTFNASLNMYRCCHVQLSGGTSFKKGVYLHSLLGADITDCSFSGSSVASCLQLNGCNWVQMQRNSFTNSTNASSARYGIMAYGSRLFMRNSSTGANSISFSGTTQSTSVGIALYDITYGYLQNVSVSNASTGVTADKNSCVQVASLSFNNVTTQYSPALGTTGNRESLITT